MKKILLTAIAFAGVTFAVSAADETVYETVKAFNPNERTATQGKDGQTPPRWYSFDNLGTTPDDVFSLAGRDIENLRLEFDLYVEYTGSEPDVTFAGLPWGTKNSNDEPIYSPFLSIDGDVSISFSDHGKAATYAEKYLKNVKEGWNHMEIDFSHDQLSDWTVLETSTFKKVTMNFARVLNTDFIIKSKNFKITDRSNKVVFEQISGDSFVGSNTNDNNLTNPSYSVQKDAFNVDGTGTGDTGFLMGFRFDRAVDASEYEPNEIYLEFDFNIETEDAELKDFVQGHFKHGQLEVLNSSSRDQYELNLNPMNIGFKAGENTYRLALSSFNLNNQSQPFDYGNIAYGALYMYFTQIETPFKATMSNPRIMVQKIVPIENVNTGVDDIVTEDADAPVEYFNLQGVRVANPENGLFIRRQGNKVTKVLVK